MYNVHKKYKLFVISHTHWDREWYQTFQVFRKRLVYLIDELIEHMERDYDYKYFHMDGQTIVLEDYLQIRPENKERLERLIRQGRIIIGPWYVMPDEFLVSGESLIRNLAKGFEISGAYGVEPMKNGYLVDIFGHNSQMPQILNGFGIDSAVLFRGIGDYHKDTFRWAGTDGSEVLCLKLDKERSYSNFYFAIRWPFEGRNYEKNELIKRMEELLSYSKEPAVSNKHDGLYITRWKIIHHMNIPLKMEESGRERSTEIGELKIVTFIEMKKGSSKLEFTTFINNELCEHRVRALFPCNINADRFFTSTPFCLQERAVEKLDWSDYNETETGVVPNQGIAVIKDEKDCLAIYNRGLYELEVMEDESRTIALTLFRSFKKEVFRDVGEMSFMKMEMKFEYALDFRDGNVNLEELMIDGEAYRTGIKTVCTGSHEGLLRLSNSFLSVNIPGAVLSALKRGNGGMTIVRIYNCTKKETSGSIAFFKPLSRAFLLNLNEEVTGDMVYKENMIYVQMKPWKIMTMGVLYSE